MDWKAACLPRSLDLPAHEAAARGAWRQAGTERTSPGWAGALGHLQALQVCSETAAFNIHCWRLLWGPACHKPMPTRASTLLCRPGGSARDPVGPSTSPIFHCFQREVNLFLLWGGWSPRGLRGEVGPPWRWGWSPRGPRGEVGPPWRCGMDVALRHPTWNVFPGTD